MTTIQTFTLILVFALFSCNEMTESSSVKNEKKLVKTKEVVSVTDTIEKFEVDDFPITNEMLADKTGKYSSYKKQSGQTFSFDKVWFRNDTLKQFLVFELYTDYHRLVTYHFLENDIPNDLINIMELHVNSGKIASNNQKSKDFNGFLKQAIKINSYYFISDKGFRLGDKKQKAIDVYGKPDKESMNADFEKLEWEFIGDIFYDGKTDLKGKPLAKESFGHQIIMYFKNGKLVGQILHNAIP